jgi:hypothetical protein
MEQEGGTFTTYIDMQFGAASFSDLIRMIIQYGPSSVELLSPKEASIGLQDMQETLNETVSAVHYYVGLVVQLKEAMDKASKTSNDVKRPDNP